MPRFYKSRKRSRSRRRLRRRTRQRGGSYLPLNRHQLPYPVPSSMRGGGNDSSPYFGIQPIKSALDFGSYSLHSGFNSFMGSPQPASPNPMVQPLRVS